MKAKVLVATDDLETARSLHAVLSLADYETLFAVMVAEAVSFAENTKPDVVILDEGSLEDPSCAKWLEQHLALPAMLSVAPEKQSIVSNFPSSIFLIKPVQSLQLIHSVYTSLHTKPGGLQRKSRPT